jgi:hypothetical protein
VGLITPHHVYLTIMKPAREAKARSRAMLCMYIEIGGSNPTRGTDACTRFAVSIL